MEMPELATTISLTRKSGSSTCSGFARGAARSPFAAFPDRRGGRRRLDAIGRHHLQGRARREIERQEELRAALDQLEPRPRAPDDQALARLAEHHAEPGDDHAVHRAGSPVSPSSRRYRSSRRSATAMARRASASPKRSDAGTPVLVIAVECRSSFLGESIQGALAARRQPSLHSAGNRSMNRRQHLVRVVALRRVDADESKGALEDQLGDILALPDHVGVTRRTRRACPSALRLAWARRR